MEQLSAWSDLAVITAMVLFIVALICHAAEWGFARTVSSRSEGRSRVRRTSTAERRQRSLATVGGSESEVAGTESGPDAEADSDTAADPVGDEDRGVADGAAEQLSARERRIEMAGRLGLNISLIATACVVAGVVLRGIAAQRFPWGNMYEFTISAVAFIAIATVVMGYKFSMRWLGLPVALILSLTLGLAYTALYVDVAPLVPALTSPWFVIHIAGATIAGAAFNLGALASILYLIRSRMERKEKVSGYFTRMPSAEKLDAIAYRLHAFSFPLWTFAVAAGAVWAQSAWGRFWDWDPKETWALVTWVIYACYLHARVTAGWKGKRAAIIAIIGVASFWFNFYGVNILFDGLHSYSGL